MPAVRECVWYVSGFRRPWEAAVIDGLAAAAEANLSAHPKETGFSSLRVCVDGGTVNFRADGVMSWRSLTFFEKLALVLFKGKLWHLWGDAPFWWGLVRLRARTAHTSLEDSPRWRGFPTRLFEEQARYGESPIVPTFESKTVWAKEDKCEESSSTIILATKPGAALGEALDELSAESGMTSVPLSGSETDATLRSGGILLAGKRASDALLAAYLTTRGIPVIADASASTTLLSAVLGRGGYIVPRADDKESWKEALRDAASEEGRARAASARRFLKEHCSASDAAESLENLYRAVMRGRSR
jgi:hypothetical protein